VLVNRDFVVFSDDWGRHPSSCQHVFRRLARRNRVLWVNTIGTRTPRLSRSDLARAAGKLREWTRPAPEQAADDAVRVIRPFMTPFDRWRIFRSGNSKLVGRAVTRAMAIGGFRDAVAVTTIPNAAGVMGRLGEASSVYYCVDEYSEWPGADRRAMLEMERELLARVDLVVVTSEALFEAKSAKHPRVRLLPHGVDWERFRAGSGRVPPGLERLPRPRVGYAGLVDDRLDAARVAALARAMPDTSFVFVGPRQLGPAELDGQPNVHFLPAVPYDDVPAVLAALDVAFLPYVESELTARMNPLKLRELLAAGLPVVAAPLPEIARLAGVRLARDQDDWMRALRAALAEGRSEAAARSASVRDQSWEVRAEEFGRLIHEAEAASRSR
jgi:glycosyltransferase involved in cell wall biosynthesis